jgi:hypothetical protein
MVLEFHTSIIQDIKQHGYEAKSRAPKAKRKKTSIPKYHSVPFRTGS